MQNFQSRAGRGNSIGLLDFFLTAVVVFSFTAAAPGRAADRFEVATIFLELNDTDGDLGIQALVDGEAWRSLMIEDPNGREILAVSAKGRLARQGLTEVFFESDEPSFDELSPEEFLQRFPEGRYEFEGVMLDGSELESTARLTHVLPAPPANILISGQMAAPNCDAEVLPVVSGDVIITWDQVTTSHPTIGRSAPIKIDGYQVVVEREEPTLLVFSVDLPASVTQMTVPPEFITLGTEFKFEVLVREAGGNQTVVESCFKTE
ncbi:MAG: hypothetical protein ACREQW_23875 [Candidatus Binatia bacterium]